MFKLLEFFLITSDVTISENAKVDMLELPKDYELKKIQNNKIKRVGNTKNKRPYLQRCIVPEVQYLSSLTFDNDYEIDLLCDHLKLINEVLKEGIYYIQNYTEPLPPHSENQEYCLCKKCVKEFNRLWFQGLYIRLTLLNDEWFENDENTKRRDTITEYLHYTWQLEMLFRVLDRRNSLLVEKNSEYSIEPMWINANKFANKGFPVLSNDKMIGEWNCEEINEAILMLIRCRSHEGILDFELRNSSWLFAQYKQAIQDRMAVLLFTQFEHPGQTNNPTWYKVTSTISKEVISKKDIILTDKTTHAVSKQVRSYLEKAKDSVRKDMEMEEDFMDEEQRQLKEIKILPMSVRCKMALEEFDEIKNDELLMEQERLQNQIEFIKEDLEEIYDDDEDKIADQIQLENLKSDLIIVTDTLKQLNVSKMTYEREKVEEHEEKIKNIFKEKKSINELACVTNKWIREHALYSDFLSSWQLKNNKFRLRTFDNYLLKLEKHLFNTVQKVMIGSTDEALVEKGQKFVYTHFFCSFFEREAYREEYGTLSSFNSQEVGSYTRDNLVFLDDYPVSHVRMLSVKNHYHNKTYLFFVSWWLNQIFRGFPINSSVFLWDVEIKFCDLTRKSLNHPCISHIGSEFIVMEGPEWETKDGWLNCTWCGPNFMKAFTHWISVMDKQNIWVIHDRKSNKTLDVRKTDLYEALLDFKEKNS